MKILCLSLLLSLAGLLYAQDNKKDGYDFGVRNYGTDFCNCPTLSPGDKAPDSHPYAKYINDPTLWEWKDGPYPGTKVYDLGNVIN